MIRFIILHNFIHKHREYPPKGEGFSISFIFPIGSQSMPVRSKSPVRRKYQISFSQFTNHIYYGLCYKHESSQVQYRNVLSVKILAKISPSGSDAMIRSAAANQDAETDKDMIPRL